MARLNTRHIGAATVLLLRNRNSTPVNSVAPSATPNPPVIGTAMTYTAGTWTTGTPAFTRWEKSATGVGSWSSVAATMPNHNSAPTDTEFGLYLRPVETNGGVEAAGAAVGPVADVPNQSVTSERFANPGFATDTAWTKGGGWSIGSGVATHTAGSSGALTQATGGSAGQYVEHRMTVSNYSAGTASQRIGNTSIDRTANGTYCHLARRPDANSTDGVSALSTLACDVDNVSEVFLTLNTQLTAPSANMRIDFLYTLPGTPVNGEAVWVMPRISDFATGNYWLAYLIYTGSQWNINLFSVATHTRTSRIAATNIGATNGIRVTANGDSWELFTTANSGGLWTSRGTATNSTYNTATGVNVMYASTVTPGQLAFANP